MLFSGANPNRQVVERARGIPVYATDLGEAEPPRVAADQPESARVAIERPLPAGAG